MSNLLKFCLLCLFITNVNATGFGDIAKNAKAQASAISEQTKSSAAKVSADTKAAATTTAATAKETTKETTEAAKSNSAGTTSSATDKVKDAAKSATDKALVNINTAPQADLEKIPGIGAAKAKAIISNRPYKSVDDLKKVKGIKSNTLAKIKDLVTI